MNVFLNIVKRELGSYFSTPLAYVFIVIFLTLIGSFTFYLGNFFVIKFLLLTTNIMYLKSLDLMIFSKVWLYIGFLLYMVNCLGIFDLNRFPFPAASIIKQLLIDLF